jgi:RimJ/RimL family protein N-acetyltransferase
MISLKPLANPDDIASVNRLVAEGAGRDPLVGPGDTFCFEALSSEETVGYVILHSIDWVARRGRGAVWIAPDSRNAGVGVEVIRALQTLAFDEFNLQKLESAVASTNVAMIKALEATGDVQEGTLRRTLFANGKYSDYLLYAAFRKE